MDSLEHSEVLIVGAGMAGASLAHFLAPRRRVVLLEAEAQPGYHTTGRSAAMFMESYGTATIRALTRASRAFYEAPPDGFAAAPLLTPRGALLVAAPEQADELSLAEAELGLPRLSRDEVLDRVPALRPERVAGGLFDDDAADIDVHALHQGFLRGARSHGARLLTDARVDTIAREGSGWRVRAGARTWRADVIVNAAGAWADELAALAGLPRIGLQPKRRAAFTFAPPPGLATAHWPCVVDVGEQWYFKPDAGALLGSPANADPVAPHDVRPEELDIATGIDRLEQATTLQIRRPTHTWAGLRSFVADGDLVAGFDPLAPGFFWLAAQGGYGIQTAPAMGALCAAWICGDPWPEAIVRAGVAITQLDIARLRLPSSR